MIGGAGAIARRILMLLWDCAAWLVAIAFVVVTRYEFYLSDAQWASLLVYAAMACLAQSAPGTFAVRLPLSVSFSALLQDIRPSRSAALGWMHWSASRFNRRWCDCSRNKALMPRTSLPSS